MPGNVKREVTRERETRAWDLRQRGLTQELIAAELGIARSTVGTMLARIDRRVLAQLNVQVEAQKVAQSSQLDHIICEMFQAFEKSKAAAVSKTVRKMQPGAGKGGGDKSSEPATQESVSQTAQYGDTEYLREARAAMADKRKLWGLDAPVKTAATNARGEDRSPDVRIDDLKDLFRAMKDWTPPVENAPPKESPPEAARE